MFDFSNYFTKSKYYFDSKNLVVGSMKHETSNVATEKFVGLKPKMYWFLVDSNSENKKAKDVNRNVVATRNYNEYKCVLLNNKCLKHSINRIQSKNGRIGTYEIFSLPCFKDKSYPKQWIWRISSWLVELNIKKISQQVFRKAIFSDYKNLILIFSVIFFIYLFSIYKMIDREYSTDDYNSSKTSTGAVMKNPHA